MTERLTCAECGATWPSTHGASCLACLAKGRERDDGTLDPDPRYYDPAHLRPQLGQRQAQWIGYQKWRAANPTPEPRNNNTACRVCGVILSRATGGRRIFCAPCKRVRDNERKARFRADRVSRNLCRECGQTALPGRIHCGEHREQNRSKTARAYATAIRGGLCQFCRAVPPIAGLKWCKTCRISSWQYQRKWRARMANRNKLASARRRSQRRKAAGQCPTCTAPIAVGRLKCADCLADKCAENRERKANWAASGRCLKCGKPREDARLYCAACREQGYAYKARYRADGLCSCGRFVVKGRKSCAACLTLRRDGKRLKRAAAKREKSL